MENVFSAGSRMAPTTFTAADSEQVFGSYLIWDLATMLVQEVFSHYGKIAKPTGRIAENGIAAVHPVFCQRFWNEVELVFLRYIAHKLPVAHVLQSFVVSDTFHISPFENEALTRNEVSC